MSENKSPATVGAVTDESVKPNIETCAKSRYHYDNTEAAFCQALIVEIDNCARDIFDNSDNDVITSYNAGKIQGLVYALTHIRGIKS